MTFLKGNGNGSGNVVPIKRVYTRKILVPPDLNFSSTVALKDLGFDMENLFRTRFFSVDQILATLYPLSVFQEFQANRSISCMQIRNAGYTLEHCARLGYDIHALRAAGFPEGELLSSGIFS